MVKGFKNTEVGIIPFDWNVTELGELFEITSSKRVFQREWKTRGIPFYRARELALLGEHGFVDNELFITEEKYDEFSRKHEVPKTGDMLVTGVGTLGKVYVVPNENEFYFKDGNIIWFKIRNVINADYLKQLFYTKVITKQIDDASGKTTVGTYTITGAKKTLIPLPPIKAEQTAIATALNDADALISQLEKLIAKKKAIKQGAMQELLKPKEGWEEKEFGEIFKKINAKSFQLQTKEYQSSGSFPIIDQGKEKIVGYTDNKNKLFNCPKKGIIVFGDHTRILKFIDFNFAIGADGTQLLDVKDKYSSKFMFYFLSLNEVPNTGYNRHFKFLVKMKYIVPVGETEQANIAQILSDLDSEIQKMKIKIEKYKMLKIGMMQCLLTGKIRLV